MVGADCSYDGWDLLGISYLETRIPALEQEFMLCNWLFLSSDRPIPAHDKLFVSCYKLQEIPVLWQPVSTPLQNICVLWQAIPAIPACLPLTGNSSPVIGYSCPATCYSGPATCCSYPVSGNSVARGVIPTLEKEFMFFGWPPLSRDRLFLPVTGYVCPMTRYSCPVTGYSCPWQAIPFFSVTSNSCPVLFNFVAWYRLLLIEPRKACPVAGIMCCLWRELLVPVLLQPEMIELECTITYPRRKMGSRWRRDTLLLLVHLLRFRFFCFSIFCIMLHIVIFTVKFARTHWILLKLSLVLLVFSSVPSFFSTLCSLLHTSFIFKHLNYYLNYSTEESLCLPMHKLCAKFRGQVTGQILF